MTIAQRIGAHVTSVEGNIKANEFVQVARAILASQDSDEAARFLRRVPGSERARQALAERAAMPAGTTYDSAWAGALTPYQSVAAGFADSLRTASCFDRILGDESFLRLPPMTQVAVTTLGGTGAIVNEAAPKPATQLTMTSASLSMSKTQAFVCLSAELARSASPGSLALIQRELRAAVGVTSDQYFLNQITAGTVAIPSSGTNALAIRNDIRMLLDAVSFGANARLYFIGPTALMKRLASVGDSSGGKMFIGLTPTGGTIDGVPALASDAATASTLTLVDASQVAVAAGVVELDRSEAATLQLDGTPDSPPLVSSNYQSLWQLNLAALRAERYLSVQRLRSTAVAQVSNMVGTGNSPA